VKVSWKVRHRTDLGGSGAVTFELNAVGKGRGHTHRFTTGDSMKRLAALSLVLLLVACENEGPLESAGEAVDDAVEDLRERGESAGDAIDDAIEEAEEEIEDATE
jgi:hypothetical protein